MRSFHLLLDKIVAKESRPPAIVEVLRLPGIDGWEEGRIWGEWDVDPVMVGPGGVFGGYLSAVADSYAGMCMYTVLEDGEWLATRELSMRFLAPVPGGRVRTESSIVKTEGRRVWVDTVFTDASGVTVCTAQVVQVVVAARRTGAAAQWQEEPPAQSGTTRHGAEEG
ncbi:PaaI family thioesterase [Streptomyces sp. cmx-4-9]|uniref:PaaI family thioesterase n=1 Tax=Streptomyces sp. cmx-4-9 TaxID=2790941 RepID=UPI0039808D82